MLAAVKSTNYSGANRPTYLHHNLTTHSIEMIGPDTARGRCYFTVYTDCGPDHHGVYTDKYVKVGDEWLFSRRKITVDWFSPDSFAGRAAAAAGLK